MLNPDQDHVGLEEGNKFYDNKPLTKSVRGLTP